MCIYFLHIKAQCVIEVKETWKYQLNLCSHDGICTARLSLSCLLHNVSNFRWLVFSSKKRYGVPYHRDNAHSMDKAKCPKSKLWIFNDLSFHSIFLFYKTMFFDMMWTASSEFGTYRLCEQRRFRRACASAQSRQNLRCSLIQAVSQEEPSDRKPDPWPLWMAGHAQLKFVMTECSKTQIRLTGLM